MSYLLFLDESGHDHRTMPYEVRGGVALHASEARQVENKKEAMPSEPPESSSP